VDCAGRENSECSEESTEAPPGCPIRR